MSYVPTVAGKLSIILASFLPVFIVDRVDLRRTDWETSSKLCASIPMLDSDFPGEIPRGEIPHGFGNPPDFHGEKRQIILLQPCQWAPVALRIDPDHI